jgi:hypothetical protein
MASKRRSHLEVKRPHQKEVFGKVAETFNNFVDSWVFIICLRYNIMTPRPVHMHVLWQHQPWSSAVSDTLFHRWSRHIIRAFERQSSIDYKDESAYNYDPRIMPDFSANCYSRFPCNKSPNQAAHWSYWSTQWLRNQPYGTWMIRLLCYIAIMRNSSASEYRLPPKPPDY